jgi:SAM-dependent methyltransferase
MIKCKICGSDTRTIYDDQFNINYYNCIKCEFIQMDDSKEVDFKRERQVYDLHNNSLEDTGYVSMFKKFLEEAVFPFKAEGTLLDFGSGPTPVLAQIIERDTAFKVEHYDLHFQPMKVYENKKYDVIVSTEVVEHLSDPVSFFKLFKDHLNSGGILAVMTLFHYNDEQAFKKWWYRRDETHISFFNLVTFREIANQLDMTILYCDDKRICTFEKK